MIDDERADFPPPPDDDGDGSFFAEDLFHDLDGPPPLAPDIQWILRETQPGRRAGKSYKPDPTGQHRAVKVTDYKSGSEFIAAYRMVGTQYDLYCLLRELAPDPKASLVRGNVRTGSRNYVRHNPTGLIGYRVNRRTAARHADGCFEPQQRRLQMADLDGIQLPADMSVVVDPQACVLWVVEHLFPPEFRDVDLVYQLSVSAGLSKPDDQLSAHIWFFTDRPFSDE